MHSINTTYRLMILSVTITFFGQTYGANNVAAMQALVATKALPVQTSGGSPVSADESTDVNKKTKQDDAGNKKNPRLMRNLYSKNTQQCIDQFVLEAKERAKILELANKLTSLLDCRQNHAFIAGIQKLKTDIKDFSDKCETLKKLSADVAVSEKNKSEFQGLVSELAQLGEDYNSYCNGRLLLYGPPGVGKTSLAAEIASDVGGTLIPIRASTLINAFANSGSENLQKSITHALNEAERTGKPSFVFLDEMDCIAGRGHISQVHRSAAQTLLMMIEAMGRDPRLVFVGATSFEKRFHDAFRCRFVEHNFILLDSLQPAGRKALLIAYLKDKKIYDNVDLKTVEAIVKKTDKFGTRGMRTLVDNFALEVALNGDKKIKLPHEKCIAIMERARKRVTASNDEYWQRNLFGFGV